MSQFALSLIFTFKLYPSTTVTPQTFVLPLSTISLNFSSIFVSFSCSQVLLAWLILSFILVRVDLSIAEKFWFIVLM